MPEKLTGAHPMSALIATNARRLRVLRGMTVDEVHSAVARADLPDGYPRLSRSSLAALEQGSRKVSVDDLAPLLLALQCDLGDLLRTDVGDPMTRAVDVVLPDGQVSPNLTHLLTNPDSLRQWVLEGLDLDLDARVEAAVRRLLGRGAGV